MSIKDAFIAGMRYRVGLGDKIFFWYDIWVNDRPLASQFAGLYSSAGDHMAKVGDYMDVNAGQVLWGPTFRRNLIESEEHDLLSFGHSQWYSDIGWCFRSKSVVPFKRWPIFCVVLLLFFYAKQRYL